MLEKLKLDLKEAVSKKDYAKITQLREILNISDEQAKYFEQGLTGYPSIDKVYLNYYSKGADERARNIPLDKTVWDVLKEKILEYYDYPVLEYFGRLIQSEEFVETVDTWARTFRAMGVEADEIVPVYGPLTPDIAAMAFALNTIGATCYFLKLAMSPEDLAKETQEAKIAVVYDGMWSNVAGEFSKDKFKKVIVSTVTSDMPSPKKQIVSFLSAMQAKKNHSQIPDDKKYIWADKAKQIADYYTGKVEVPFVPNRTAFITSSSGTSIGSTVKGVMATNESILSQVFSTCYSDIPYAPGVKVLNHFPPTAATSMNSIFLSPIYSGATVVIDPRVSFKDFYNQIMTLKPNVIINTSSMWELFFARIEQELNAGKKFDFSYATGWMIGGEGTSVKKLKWMNDIMRRCNGTRLYGGYGLSEVFSGICIDRIDVECDYSKPVACVGIPQAGMTVRVVDKDGNELSYNQRGSLEVETTAAMKGYYNKPELTAKAKDGYVIRTGDQVEIDEKGYLYVWGRCDNHLTLKDNSQVYLFDVEVLIKENDCISDAVVLSKPTQNNEYNLVAHIVWADDYTNDQKKEFIAQINQQLAEFLPKEVVVSGFAEHDKMLPYSPTSLKKDRNGMLAQNEGYLQTANDQLINVNFIKNENGQYSTQCAIIEQDRVKKLKK